MTAGYITYTRGPTGVWIAWHTPVQPPPHFTAREIAASAGPVLFAIGETAEDALAKLRAEHPIEESGA